MRVGLNRTQSFHPVYHPQRCIRDNTVKPPRRSWRSLSFSHILSPFWSASLFQFRIAPILIRTKDIVLGMIACSILLLLVYFSFFISLPPSLSLSLALSTPFSFSLRWIAVTLLVRAIHTSLASSSASVRRRWQNRHDDVDNNKGNNFARMLMTMVVTHCCSWTLMIYDYHLHHSLSSSTTDIVDRLDKNVFNDRPHDHRTVHHYCHRRRQDKWYCTSYLDQTGYTTIRNTDHHRWRWTSSIV